jgi:hypothetical protein
LAALAELQPGYLVLNRLRNDTGITQEPLARPRVHPRLKAQAEHLVAPANRRSQWYAPVQNPHRAVERDYGFEVAATR